MAKSDGPFMLDGFPRNQDNVNAWTEMMEANTNTVGMLVLKLSPDVCNRVSHKFFFNSYFLFFLKKKFF